MRTYGNFCNTIKCKVQIKSDCSICHECIEDILKSARDLTEKERGHDSQTIKLNTKD